MTDTHRPWWVVAMQYGRQGTKSLKERCSKCWEEVHREVESPMFGLYGTLGHKCHPFSCPSPPYPPLPAEMQRRIELCAAMFVLLFQGGRHPRTGENGV